MSLDLWWPWWVTTLIAVGVSIVAAAALVRVRRPLARGVLATLAVEGVLVAVLAPVVMGNDSMRSAAGEPLTKEEFARRADANCTWVGNQAAKLGNPKTLADTATFMTAFIPIFNEGFAAQGVLVPPADQADNAMAWMNAMAAEGHEFARLRDAARRRDQVGVAQANERIGELDQKNLELSERLGMKVCFQTG